VTIMLRGEDDEKSELTFTILSVSTNGELSPITDQPCTSGSSNSDNAGHGTLRLE
jgi:hypothetical protein